MDMEIDTTSILPTTKDIAPAPDGHRVQAQAQGHPAPNDLLLAPGIQIWSHLLSPSGGLLINQLATTKLMIMIPPTTSTSPPPCGSIDLLPSS
jgi:hypothetical protein